MGRNKPPKIPHYLQGDEISGHFAMVDPALFEVPGFQRLSHAARCFYIVLAGHVASSEQRAACYSAACEYRDYGILLKNDGSRHTDEELRALCYGIRKPYQAARWFVCPDSQMKRFGYSQQYLSKIRGELKTKGFIETVAGGKGAHCGWDRNVTIYRFSDRWRKITNNHSCL